MIRLFARLIFRSLFRDLPRAVVILLGFIFAVGGILTSGILAYNAADAEVRFSHALSGESDVLISPASGSRDSMPDSLLRRVANLTGVQVAVPSLVIHTSLIDPSSSRRFPIGFFDLEQRGDFLLLAVDPSLEPLVRTYSVVEGRFLDPEAILPEVVLWNKWANERGFSPGQTLPILTPQGATPFVIVGLIDDPAFLSINQGAFAVVHLEMGQRYFNYPQQIGAIHILTRDDSRKSLEALSTQLEARLGSGYHIAVLAQRGSRIDQVNGNTYTAIYWLNAIIAFAGIVLVLVGFYRNESGRKREYALMHLVGVARRQMIVSYLLEASILGLLGAVLSVGVSLGMARLWLQAVLLSTSQIFYLPDATATLFGIAILIGLLIANATAAFPAWKAGKTSPLELFETRPSQTPGWIARHGWWLGGLLMLLAGLLLYLKPFPNTILNWVGSLAVMVFIGGITLLFLGGAGAWAWITRPVFGLVFKVSGRMGSGNVQRFRSRDALLAAGLMSAAIFSVFMLSSTAAFENHIREWVDKNIGGDLIIHSQVSFSADLARQIEGLEGISAVVPVSYDEIQWERLSNQEERLTFMAVDPLAFQRVAEFSFIDAKVDQQKAIERLAAGEVVFVSSVLANQHALKAGDIMRLNTALGWRNFEIAAVINNFYRLGRVVVGSSTDMQRLFKERDFSTLIVTVEGDHTALEVAQRVLERTGDDYQLMVLPTQQVKDQAITSLSKFIGWINAMAWLSLSIVLFAVAIVLNHNVSDQRHELAFLRRIGMNHRQVMWTVITEALSIGLLGAVFGLGLGWLLARFYFVDLVTQTGFSTSFEGSIPAGIAVFFSVVVGAPVVALWPAWRAARAADETADR